MKLRRMIWLLGTAWKLSLENKILIYKAMMKPVWTYGLQLWGSVAVAILQRFQNKIIQIITNYSNNYTMVCNKQST